MLSRRKFLRYTLSGLAGITLTKCVPAKGSSEINIRFKPDNSGRAHQLRDTKQQFKTGETIYKDVVIVGAGISGLSAGYHLKTKGIHNFTVYELGEKAGGNSGSGKNAISEYPHGAHYLTLPNPANTELIAFLSKHAIIKGFDENGRPVFNETDLCLDPEERLYIRGVFQEGLVPDYGLSKEEKAETKRFFDWVKAYKEKKGSDGKYFFEMPSSLASIDKSLDLLDEITFGNFLIQNNFSSPHLLWYLNYCCRDDYGGGIDKVSAWAGINYFASHRAEPSNTDASRILTWPEGNGYLVKIFEKELSNHIATSCLVESVSIVNENVELLVKNFTNNTITRVICKHCVLAVPPFVVAKILSPQLNYPFEVTKQLEHSPWLVATVTLSHLDANNQSPVCWDNVAFQSKSLGYINNQHQHLKQLTGGVCLTLYMPLDDEAPLVERKKAREKDLNHWKNVVLTQLEEMHPGISENVNDIEIGIWGHGMILPKPGLTKGKTRELLSRPIQDKLFFAHTDLSAYSVFEEGFDQGLRASQKIVELLV